MSNWPAGLTSPTWKRAMKPRLLTILLLLLAGAVVNVGVAWGCSF